MKTTIELSDTLMREMKELANQRKTTMRSIIEAALRLYLEKQKMQFRRISSRITLLKEKGCVRECRRVTGTTSAKRFMRAAGDDCS